MTRAEVNALMLSSRDGEEWDANCDKVKASFGGDYPAYWFEDILASGLYARVSAEWGSESA